MLTKIILDTIKNLPTYLILQYTKYRCLHIKFLHLRFLKSILLHIHKMLIVVLQINKCGQIKQYEMLELYVIKCSKGKSRKIIVLP